MNEYQNGDIELIKTFLSSCRSAKRIVSEMPELPEGITPRHVRAADILHQQLASGNEVKISDIADSMGVTRPSVTRLITQLEKKGYLIKKQHPSDRRVFTLSFTEKGELFYDKYIRRYFRWVAGKLGDLDPDDLRTAVRVIEYARRKLADHRDFDEEAE